MISFDEAVDMVSKNLGYDIKSAKEALAHAVDRGEIKSSPAKKLGHAGVNEIALNTMFLTSKKMDVDSVDVARFMAKREMLSTGKYDSLVKLEADKSSGFLFDTSSVNYPLELDLAIKAWQAVSTADGKGKPKARLRTWLNENTNLSNEAKDRISTVANWDKTGGATRTV